MPNIVIGSAIITGLAPSVIEIEASFTRGFAGLQLLGNPSEVCREGKERAKIALEHLGLRFPNKRIMLSLNPADIYKDSNHLDLAMAVALALLLREKPPAINLENWLFLGELGLAGQIKPVRGIPSLLLKAVDQGLPGLVLAEDNAAEARFILQHLPAHKGQPKILATKDLKQVLSWIDGEAPRQTPHGLLGPSIKHPRPSRKTFADMFLSAEQQKLATVIAVGFHHCLLSGPPGTGKTMFAERIPSLLPPLDPAEKIRALKIHGLMSTHFHQAILHGERPVKTPHHSSSLAAITGNDKQPGELSLATGGVLFLDEFTEFRRDLLEALREPMVSGFIAVSRVNRKVIWDANVLLLAATNNCSCGNWGSRFTPCSCSSNQLHSFRRKLSGPLLDRIDLHCNFTEIADPRMTTWFTESHLNHVQHQNLVRTAQAAQHFSFERNRKFNCKWNRDLDMADLRHPLGLSTLELECAITDLQRVTVSKRSVGHALRVARTLADCALREKVEPEDIKQAHRWLKDAVAPERGFISR